MFVVSLETSEMDDFVSFKLATEKEELGGVLSSPEHWHQWAKSGQLDSEQFFVAKNNNGEWLGAAHWTRSAHEAKIFPFLRRLNLTDAERTEISIKLMGKVLHAILSFPEIQQVTTRPLLNLLDAGYRKALTQAGFHLLGERVEYKTPVSQLPQEIANKIANENANEIEWRTVLTEDELHTVAAIFKEAVEGDAHALDVLANPLGCIKEALSQAELTSDLSGIQIGYVNHAPAAYVHVQISPKTGWSRVTYMGVLKKFRGKGLGKLVHLHCFAMIRELGGTLYHGGTSAENLAMIRLFESSHCVKFAEMQEWQLDLKSLRETLTIPELSTSRLRLEPMCTNHAGLCYEHFQDTKLYRYIDRNPPTDLESFAPRFSFLQKRLSYDLSEFWWNWVCLDKLSNQPIGTIEVSYLRETGEAHLAYTVFTSHWRKGYAKEACSVVIDFLFSKKSASKVVIEMDVRNTASVALAENLGAHKVSFNENVQMIRGEWSDEYRYEIESNRIE